MIETRRKLLAWRRKSMVVVTFAMIGSLVASTSSAQSQPSAAQRVKVADDQGASRILDSKGVSFACGTRNGDHTIYIDAYNSDNMKRICSSTCYYENSKGEIGELTNKKEVPENASEFPFAQLSQQNLTFKVINPGIGECE